MILNIAFCGLMGSGKTSAADFLVKEHGYIKLSFADRLKKIAVDACRMKGKDRELLQKLGVAIREDCENHWVNIVVKAAKYINDEGKSVVIDDLRFPNELKALTGLNFSIFRINRSREDRLKAQGLNPGETYDSESHISETALKDEPLAVIYNNSDTESFYSIISKRVQELVTLTGK